MSRFLWLLFLFLFPFITFSAYIRLCDIYGKDRPEYRKMISKLIMTGLILCGLFFIILRFSSGDTVQTGTFVPSYEKNGEIIPSHFK